MFAIITEIFTINNLLMMNIGLFAGIIIGAMPGLSVSFAVTVLLTMTIGMDSIPGMYMLLGGYCGGMFGGTAVYRLERRLEPVAPAPERDGPEPLQNRRLSLLHRRDPPLRSP